MTMDKIKSVFESLAIKIFGFISTCLGFVINILKLCGVTEDLFFSVIGTIFLFLGFVVLLFILFVQHEDIKALEKRKNELLDMNEKNESDIIELKKQSNVLIELAYNGVEFTDNTVTIHFDKKKKMYHLQFEKQFKIITDIVPEYYSAQFYANRFITNKEKAKQFYDMNPLDWNKLNVKAWISYKSPNSKKYTNDKPLEIVSICNNTNYIPFKIMYKHLKTGAKIDLIKGTEVIIKYSYDVPISHWGSYINRTISYFGESAKVVLKYDSDCKLDSDVVELKDGAPCDIIGDKDKYEMEFHQNANEKSTTFILKSKPGECSRFRVKWDANEYFEETDMNTEDGKDLLGITNK